MARAFGQVGGGQAAYTLFQGLFVLVSVRFLAPAALAEYSVGIAVFTVVSGLTTSALRRAYIIDFKELRLDEAQGHFVAAQALLLTLALVIVCAISRTSPVVVGALVALVVANTVFENARLFLQRHQQFRGFAVLTAAQPAAGLLGLVGLLALQQTEFKWAASGWAVLLSQALARILVVLPLGTGIATLFRRAGDVRGILRVTSHLVRGRYYLLGLHYGALNWLLTSGLFFLDGRGDTLEAAAYGATQRYYGVLLGLVITAQAVLLPALAKAESPSEIKSLFRSYYIICGPLTAAVGVLAVGAPIWIPLIDQGQYPSSIVAFQLMAAMIGVSLWTSIHSTVLTKARAYVPLVIYAAAGCGVTFALAATTPWRGAVGVAVATAVGFTVCSVAVACHSAIIIRRDVRRAGE